MDELALRVLAAEISADLQVIQATAGLAKERFDLGSDAALEAAAYQLSRCYNALEQMAARIAKGFENQISDRTGWHVELMRRLSMAIPGIRPALFPPEMRADLQELRGFRHVFHHAYDLVLDSGRLILLLDAANRVANALPGAVQQFLSDVIQQEGWSSDELRVTSK